jgi:glycosyltransferase involved in cell wall biosynthesis
MKISTRSDARYLSTCIMIGPFPPPVFGSAVATAALRDAFVAGGYNVREINTNGTRLIQDGVVARGLRRLRATGILALELLRLRPRTSIYISYAGGGGQFGDFLNVLLARLFRCPIIFHHHSFAYIRTARLLTRCIFAVAGRRARHIFLCGRMRRQAMQHYSSIRRGYILSNAALMGASTGAPSHFAALRTIGFFSNIAVTKGIDRFLELAARLLERCPSVSCEVAGPYRDDVSKQMTEAAIKAGSITYHGELEGDAKRRFFEMIDVLVLPSRYPHEAEPIVILEAFGAGVPVIATNRGCIAGLVGEGCGLVLDPNAEDINPALVQIEQWLLEEDVFIAARREALARRKQLQDGSLKALQFILRHSSWPH